MAKKDLFTDQDQKLLAFYTETNQQCQKRLNSLKRNWLSVAGTVSYSKSTNTLYKKIDKVYPIHSIYYSDRIAHSQVVYELMSSMRSWVVANASKKNSILFIVSGDAEKITLLANSDSADHGKDYLEAAFPGIVFGDPCSYSPYVDNYRRGGIVSGIPAYSYNEHEQLYSLDALLRGLRGKRFSLVIIGSPCSEDDISQVLSSIRNDIGTNHENILLNVTKQFGEGTSKTLGGSLTSFGALMSSLTASSSFSTTTANTVGGNMGVSAPIPGTPFMASLGVMAAHTVANTVTAGLASTYGNALGGALGVNYSVTKMQNRSHANSLERLNQFASAYEAALEEYETRLKNALAEGAWRTLTYVLADNDEDFKFTSSLYQSCLTAHFDVYEPFRIVPLGNVSSDWQSTILSIPEVNVAGQKRPLDTLLTSSEFASLMSLPSESHPGIEIRETPRFCIAPDCSPGKTIEMGHVCDREVETSGIMSLALKDLTAHTLVAGLTGMGKSTTIRHILSHAGLPFLVLEPAKSEYRNMSIGGNPIRIFTAGDEAVLPLRINPFELPNGDSLHSHIDSLAAILNAAFPMEGPMAALLEQGLVRAYREAGWDVVSGKAPVNNKIPSMDSFYTALETVIDEQHFQGDYGCNIKSALLARINSLRMGPRGRLFNSELPFNVADLLARPTVIEMKKVGSDETKAFLSGLLLLRIYKFFEQKGNSETLSHLLVVEEAHRIFRKTADKGNSLVGNNTTHRSVELFENILAEVRAYGLGIIIADQMPLRLSDGAIKNTNLKIIHRLGALEDAVAMGGSMGLSEERSAFICRMKPGEALVHCSALCEPVHVKVSYSPPRTGNAITDDYLKKTMVRIQASERRPPYFDATLTALEETAPRALEQIADSFLFTIQMIPAVKKERWNYAWNECVTKLLPDLVKKAELPLSNELAGHLLHSAVLRLLKGKRFISDKQPSLLTLMISKWDAALPDELHLDLEKVREVRQMFIADELVQSINMPGWLPQEYPSAKRYYLEARQMAAAIIAEIPSVLPAIRSNKLSEACQQVATVILDRAVHGIDVRGATLEDFTFAVMLALLNKVRPDGCTRSEYLAKLQNIIQTCYGGKQR